MMIEIFKEKYLNYGNFILSKFNEWELIYKD